MACQTVRLVTGHRHPDFSLRHNALHEKQIARSGPAGEAGRGRSGQSVFGCCSVSCCSACHDEAARTVHGGDPAEALLPPDREDVSPVDRGLPALPPRPARMAAAAVSEPGAAGEARGGPVRGGQTHQRVALSSQELDTALRRCVVLNHRCQVLAGWRRPPRQRPAQERPAGQARRFPRQCPANEGPCGGVSRPQHPPVPSVPRRPLCPWCVRLPSCSL